VRASHPFSSVLRYGSPVDEPAFEDKEAASAPSSPPADESTPQGNETSSVPVDEPMPNGEGTSTPPDSPASTAEPPKTQRRSNEFWLAVVGVVATTLVGVVGAVTTYFTGVEHDQQENKRQQTSFIRDQQVTAYTAFADAYGDLTDAYTQKRDEISMRNPFGDSPPKKNLEEV
jgi:hypothetical protein